MTNKECYKLVVKESSVVFNDKEYTFDLINGKLLFQIFRLSMGDKIQFSFEDENSPVSSLFKKIQEATKEGSDFRNKYIQKEAELVSNKEKIDKLESTENASVIDDEIADPL